jgi:hypothetical protein
MPHKTGITSAIIFIESLAIPKTILELDTELDPISLLP